MEVVVQTDEVGCDVVRHAIVEHCHMLQAACHGRLHEGVDRAATVGQQHCLCQMPPCKHLVSAALDCPCLTVYSNYAAS